MNDKNEIKILSIATFSKGFLLGSEDGCFTLWIKMNVSDEKRDDSSFNL